MAVLLAGFFNWGLNASTKNKEKVFVIQGDPSDFSDDFEEFWSHLHPAVLWSNCCTHNWIAPEFSPADMNDHGISETTPLVVLNIEALFE